MWKLSPKCFQPNSATLQIRNGMFHLKNHSRSISRNSESILDHLHKQINASTTAECNYFASKQRIYPSKRFSQQYTFLSSLTGLYHSQRWNSSTSTSKSAKPPRSVDLSKFPLSRIRNFSVIAHIDHGKTSLSNRLLELTGTLTKEGKEQPLDALRVEQERGITVKAHTATMFYEYNGETYLLNLIDTPGHVDFGYEVSRSLAASQGALLIIDATQGVQAQTMANFYLALEADLSINVILNKIDLNTANIPSSLQQIHSAFGVEASEVIKASAKTGQGIDEIIPAIIEKIPPPTGDPNKPLKMFLFDSWFDRYRGVICLVRIIDGTIRKGDVITSAHSKQAYEILELGILFPGQVPTDALYTGQVGYFICGMKTSKEARVGDTFYHVKFPVEPLPGFKPSKPMVFAGLYPVDTSEIEKLKDAIQKLTLNDSSVTVHKESSDALGVGFRCGFLGLLHMDVFMQRLEQEYDVSVIATMPTVPFKCIHKDGKEEIFSNPSDFPDVITGSGTYFMEPTVNSTIIAPGKYLGDVLALCEDKRGTQTEMNYLDNDRVLLRYKLPLTEITTNFYDKLKQMTSGYASFDYDEGSYEKTDLVKVTISLNGKKVDALSALVHKEQADRYGRDMTAKLKKLIDRQLFGIAIQASIGNRVLAREDISALRKNVIAKCYGGDITRKRKLLEKQKEGKKKMRMIGNIEISQEVFMAAIKRDES